MKQIFLAIALMLPAATAATVGFLPIPECMPCLSVSAATKVPATPAKFLPIPECMPCLNIAAAPAKFLPIPECMPCLA